MRCLPHHNFPMLSWTPIRASPGHHLASGPHHSHQPVTSTASNLKHLSAARPPIFLPADKPHLDGFSQKSLVNSFVVVIFHHKLIQDVILVGISLCPTFKTNLRWHFFVFSLQNDGWKQGMCGTIVMNMMSERLIAPWHQCPPGKLAKTGCFRIAGHLVKSTLGRDFAR